MEGILLVDKPAGISSFDIIRYLRRELGGKGQSPKIGHAGTLDPMATGLMILLLGKATKQAQRYLKLDKTYELELTLGAESDTADAEGTLSPVSSRQPGRGVVEAALGKFNGQIEQVPPQYSAIKVKGKPAYKYAREGQEIKLESRIVTIYRLELAEYRYPLVRAVADVSSGTYIRALAQDIGRQLDTGAYLSRLRRTSIGDLSVKDAAPMADLTAETIPERLLPTF